MSSAVTKFSLPGPLRHIGKKQIEMATQWMASAFTYGTATGIAVAYVTDWKAVLQYLPYYNGKFPTEE